MQGSNPSILVIKTYFLAQNLDYHPSCLGFHRFTTGFHNYTPESTKEFQTLREGPTIPHSSTEAPTGAAAGLESRWKVTQILSCVTRSLLRWWNFWNRSQPRDEWTGLTNPHTGLPAPLWAFPTHTLTRHQEAGCQWTGDKPYTQALEATRLKVTHHLPAVQSTSALKSQTKYILVKMGTGTTEASRQQGFSIYSAHRNKKGFALPCKAFEDFLMLRIYKNKF